MVFKKSEIGFHFKHLKSNIGRQHEGEWTGTTSYNLLWFALSNANANNLPNLWSNRCPEQVGELCEMWFDYGCFHYGMRILPLFFQNVCTKCQNFWKAKGWKICTHIYTHTYNEWSKCFVWYLAMVFHAIFLVLNIKVNGNIRICVVSKTAHIFLFICHFYAK